MIQFKLFGSLCFCLMLCISSFSQSPFEIEANIGSGNFNGDVTASTPDGFPSMSFGLRHNLNPYFAISGNYTHLSFEGTQGGYFRITNRELNMLLEWYPLKRVKLKGIDLSQRTHYTRIFQPYFIGGLTLANTSINEHNALMNCSGDFCTNISNYPALQVGSGFRLFFNENLAMNMNIAWRYTNIDEIDSIVSGQNDWYLNAQLGMVWAIRKRSITE